MSLMWKRTGMNVAAWTAVTSTPASAMPMSTASVARLSVAPMMDWTDRHYRFMMRLITKRTLLYTEMIVDKKLLHQQKNLDYFIGHDAVERPLALQLGGNNVDELGAAAKLSSEYGGFCEINLNTGCPSSRVSSGSFGARLMLEPERVRDICASMMRSVASSPHDHAPPEVTVKCRIGVDDHDSYEELAHFISTVASSGVRHFVVHARKCLLNGLSPHENRTVPPLRYDVVYRLKADFPHMFFTLNGGVASIAQAKQLLDDACVDGVMIGRAAYNTPWSLRDADRVIFGAEQNPNLSRREIAAQYIDYAEDLQATWGATEPIGPLNFTMRTPTLIKPLLALFNGEYGSKAYKREMTEQWTKKGAVPPLREIVESAMKMVPDEVLDARVEDEVLDARVEDELAQEQLASP